MARLLRLLRSLLLDRENHEDEDSAEKELNGNRERIGGIVIVSGRS
jgi:hypothetical protein